MRCSRACRTAHPISRPQRLLRGRSKRLYDHQVTSLPKQHLELVSHVGEGETWREIPQHLLPERFKKIRHTDGTNLFARPERTRPSYTIITQFGNVTTGAYTHPTQDRAFSAREGARIQSFPDSFRFYGSLLSKYKQIGNAVPPMLAKTIGEAVAYTDGDPRNKGGGLSAQPPFPRRPPLFLTRRIVRGTAGFDRSRGRQPTPPVQVLPRSGEPCGTHPPPLRARCGLSSTPG